VVSGLSCELVGAKAKVHVCKTNGVDFVKYDYYTVSDANWSSLHFLGGDTLTVLDYLLT
jgi:hypothetical protein